MNAMAESVEQLIHRLAGNRCEYCRVPDGFFKLRHVLDHIIARQHQGATVFENLALCCGRCNSYKGPNISGRDPATRALTPLFHPRQDRWHDHFRWEGPVLVGKTAVGRTTIAVLSINTPLRIAARAGFIAEGGLL